MERRGQNRFLSDVCWLSVRVVVLENVAWAYQFVLCPGSVYPSLGVVWVELKEGVEVLSRRCPHPARE